MQEGKLIIGDALRTLEGAESVRERVMGDDFEHYTEWLVRGDVGAREARSAVENALRDEGFYETDIEVYKERDGAVVVSPNRSGSIF